MKALFTLALLVLNSNLYAGPLTIADVGAEIKTILKKTSISQNDLARAADLMKDIKRSYDSSDALVKAACDENLGALYFGLKKYDLAELSLKEALSTYEKNRGKSSYNIGTTNLKMLWISISKKDSKAEEEHFGVALKEFQSKYGNDNKVIADLFSKLQIWDFSGKDLLPLAIAERNTKYIRNISSEHGVLYSQYSIEYTIPNGRLNFFGPMQKLTAAMQPGKSVLGEVVSK